MRISHYLLLPALIAADQIPLKDQATGFFNKAKSFIPGAVVNPVQAGAALIASKYVERLTSSNWQDRLSPKPEGEEEWLIYLTGGNKTCFGRCGKIDVLWNESVPLMVAQPRSAGSPPMRLAEINCETDQPVCTAWAAMIPSIFHIQLARKSVPQVKSPFHPVALNLSSTTIEKITAVPSSGGARYKEFDEYDGLLHPVDGAFRRYGILMPFGYVLWGFGSTPGWLMMIVISFFSRQIMTKKAMARNQGFNPSPPGAVGAAAAAQPRARPAPAAAAAPKSGGKKRR